MTDTLPVTFDVRRFQPEHDDKPRWQRYAVQADAGMTVLDGLLAIRDRVDPTLAWRHSCRMGICGSCAMVINGMPRLACSTQIRDVSRSRVRLRPLDNFAVKKDLVVDLAPMLNKHRAVRPYLARPGDEVAPAGGELEQTPTELLEYLQFADCIKCGACMAACPTLATDGRFLGPMPLTAMHRYNADSRDGGYAERQEAIAAFHGLPHCHFAGECSRVCPKGVDPARAIQLARRDLTARWLRLKKPSAPASVLAPGAPRSREDAPKAPPFTAR